MYRKNHQLNVYNVRMNKQNYFQEKVPEIEPSHTNNIVKLMLDIIFINIYIYHINRIEPLHTLSCINYIEYGTFSYTCTYSWYIILFYLPNCK